MSIKSRHVASVGNTWDLCILPFSSNLIGAPTCRQLVIGHSTLMVIVEPGEDCSHVEIPRIVFFKF
jgi:hypothetical protein